jgi:hypothetical protein
MKILTIKIISPKNGLNFKLVSIWIVKSSTVSMTNRWVKTGLV